MNHLPFIIAAYTVTVLVLSWTAVAPVLRMRSLRRRLSQESD